MLGGTLTELAIRQGRVEGLIAWLGELGLRHVEISDGTIALEAEVKTDLIRTLVASELHGPVGGRQQGRRLHHGPYVWVEQIERDLQAGAWKVIAEARESGTAGIYRADGEVRTGLIDEIVHAIDADRLIFEAPRREQQVWLLHRFGSECNLGNIAPGRRALAGDAAPRAALGHGRAVRAGRGRLSATVADAARRCRRAGRRTGSRRSCSRCW